MNGLHESPKQGAAFDWIAQLISQPLRDFQLQPCTGGAGVTNVGLASTRCPCVDRCCEANRVEFPNHSMSKLRVEPSNEYVDRSGPAITAAMNGQHRLMSVSLSDYPWFGESVTRNMKTGNHCLKHVQTMLGTSDGFRNHRGMRFGPSTVYGSDQKCTVVIMVGHKPLDTLARVSSKGFKGGVFVRHDLQWGRRAAKRSVFESCQVRSEASTFSTRFTDCPLSASLSFAAGVFAMRLGLG